MATANDDRKLDAQTMNQEVLSALDAANQTAQSTSDHTAKALAEATGLGGPLNDSAATLQKVLKDLEDMPCYDGFDAHKLCALAGDAFDLSTATLGQLIALRRAVDSALAATVVERGALKAVHVEISSIHVVQAEAADVYGDTLSLPGIPGVPYPKDDSAKK